MESTSPRNVPGQPTQQGPTSPRGLRQHQADAEQLRELFAKCVFAEEEVEKPVTDESSDGPPPRESDDENDTGAADFGSCEVPECTNTRTRKGLTICRNFQKLKLDVNKEFQNAKEFLPKAEARAGQDQGGECGKLGGRPRS